MNIDVSKDPFGNDVPHRLIGGNQTGGEVILLAAARVDASRSEMSLNWNHLKDGRRERWGLVGGRGGGCKTQDGFSDAGLFV